jgi:hypothetical protein
MAELHIPGYNRPFLGIGTRKTYAKLAAAKYALKYINAKTSGERAKAKSHFKYPI